MSGFFGLLLFIRNYKEFRWLNFETTEEKKFNNIRSNIDGHFNKSSKKEIYLKDRKEDEK
jgi:hypothetical protein